MNQVSIMTLLRLFWRVAKQVDDHLMYISPIWLVISQRLHPVESRHDRLLVTARRLWPSELVEAHGTCQTIQRLRSPTQHTSLSITMSRLCKIQSSAIILQIVSTTAVYTPSSVLTRHIFLLLQLGDTPIQTVGKATTYFLFISSQITVVLTYFMYIRSRM